MTYIYLIRHGRPEMPDNGTYCIGHSSDLPLSVTGQKQAEALARCFEGLHFNKVYCSTLRRSRETAELLAEGRWPICEHAGIGEINVGLWEGLSFDEIRTKYPEIYAARGEDWSISPPGGESLAEAADRMETAIKEIIHAEHMEASCQGTDGEATGGVTGPQTVTSPQTVSDPITMKTTEKNNHILAVTHDGAIRGLLWKIMNPDTKKDAIIRQPYGSITVLKYNNGQLSVTAAGKLPEDYPTDEEIEQFWDICETPENVRDHCYAVCNEALEIWEQLKDAGPLLAHKQLRAASLLHDMCRRDGKDHPKNAAKLIRERGYLQIARLVELHHGNDGNDGSSFNEQDEKINEAQVLYLADKRIQGMSKVTVQERFETSLKKCITEEARRKHCARYQEALSIENKINKKLEGTT